MASPKTWSQLRYFKQNSSVDSWGDPGAIDDLLLLSLDDFRHHLNVPLYVTSGVRPDQDGKESYHTRRKGACAVDVMAPQCQLSPIDLVFTALRFGFSGLGYYPDWSWNGIKCGGLHLDTRPLGVEPDGTIDYNRSLWMGIKVLEKSSDNKEIQRQIYIPLSHQNMVKHTHKGALHA